MKRLKSKKTLLFGGILCLVAAALGATIAYNHDSSTLANEFSIGAYEVTTSEVFVSPNNWQPGDETEKTLTVSNNSNEDIMVRVKYKGVWRNAADTRNLPPEKDGVELAQIVLQNQSDWELKGDGYYYYKNALAPNNATSSLFQKVVLNPGANFGADNVCTSTSTGTVCKKPTDNYEGAKYHLKITAESVQADAADEAWRFALLDTGENVNEALKRLAGTSPDIFYKDPNIQSIAVVDTLPATIDPAVAAKTDIAVPNTDPIYAYDDGDHNIYIHADGRTLYANEDSSDLFHGFGVITSLTLSESFNTSLVTDMSGMFEVLGTELTSLTLPSSFDTSSVTNMRYMFSGNLLTSLTLPESFDTSNVTDMQGMFNESYRLTSLVFPESFDTSSVTNMSWMFSFIDRLTTLTFPSSFNTSSVTDMSNMFTASTDFTSLTLPDSFDTSNVTNMEGMFNDTRSLTSLTLPDSFDTSNVTNMEGMFSCMDALTSLTLPDSFDTSNVTNMKDMFGGARSLTSLTLPANFVVGVGTDATDIFKFIPTTATLNSSADASVKALWPGSLRN